MKPVILESPYRGNNYEDTEENIRFARLCMHDCFLKGEAPFASHLLYTQEGILDDKIPDERTLGIEAGFVWKGLAQATIVYVNRGISGGMHLGIRKTIAQGQSLEYRSLSGYERLPAPTLVTITGASGVGKTSIIKRFLEVRPYSRLIQSVTSRSARPTDLEGEYEYELAIGDFEQAENDFLWVIPAHGNYYATRRKSICEFWLRRTPFYPGCMILVPEVLPLLRTYLVDCDRLLSFYVLSPSEEELTRRLTARGDDKATIQKRIDDCRKWDAEALRSDIPYVFLSNDESGTGIEKAVEQMCVFL